MLLGHQYCVLNANIGELWGNKNAHYLLREEQPDKLILLSGTITVVRYQNNNDIISKLDEFLKTTLTGLVLLSDYCSVDSLLCKQKLQRAKLKKTTKLRYNFLNKNPSLSNKNIEDIRNIHEYETRKSQIQNARLAIFVLKL